MKPVDIIKFLGSHKNNLLKDNPQEGWCLREFELNTIENYNEFYYFHPNVQKVIFNKNTFQKHKSMRYLIREDFKFLEAKFYGSNNKEITVMTEIKSIDLHLFDNQIGLITITTQKHQNNNETTFENFLQYNDTVRRIYPPFLGDNSTQTTKEKRLLPTQIILKDKTGNVKGTEDFNPINLNDPQNKGKDILYLSNVIREILIPFELKEKYYNDELEKDKIYYTPFIDDRMFVVSYYSDQELFNKLKTNYETVDEWYRFIFVDGNYANIKNDTMKKSLVQKHTYTRWLNSGTLYGMSRYGFVMLCDGSEDYLRQHMKSIYYQMSLIILFQRMMLLKFAEEVDEVTKHFEETETDFVELQEKTKELHADFIKFINKYWFIEITPQEQGIEIYNQWKGLLDLEELYDEVHREISELA
ncbi:MAG: hypothetical protein HY934_04810, partial [Candidatus Firestonebacteria bacterium]|nr:hypothetical protein [Candidatus Firestonebacteria bacterium]